MVNDHIWLVVWNMTLIFHILGIIIPTDEFIFFKGVETTNQLLMILKFPLNNLPFMEFLAEFMVFVVWHWGSKKQILKFILGLFHSYWTIKDGVLRTCQTGHHLFHIDTEDPLFGHNFPRGFPTAFVVMLRCFSRLSCPTYLGWPHYYYLGWPHY